MKKTILSFMAVMLLLTAIPLRTASAAPSGMAFLSEYVQTLFDEDSEIPVSQVKSILQSSDGYMWFAGYQGLMRYNGIDTKVFSPEDGFPSYNVNILYEDSRGRLWIGTNDNGIVLKDGNRFIIYGIAEGLASASVRGITEDEYANIYVATTGGIASISADGALTEHPALNNAFATHIEYIGDGRFICLLNNGEIIRFDETEIIEIYDSDYFGAAQPLSLFSGDGEFYIGTAGNTVYIASPDLLRHKTLTLPTLQTINNFYKDREGRIWLCADNGLGYLTDGTYTPVEGLEMSNSIECVYGDYEGGFWIGSSRQGLLRLTRGKFTNISFMAELTDYTVNTTAIWKNDLYIGADEGLVILRDSVPIQNELTEMMQNIRIRCILADSKGYLWICTYENYGVLLIKQDGSIVFINEANGLASNKVRCIVEAHNGDLLVGMSGGVSIIRDEKVIKSYTKDDGLVNDVILSLCEDKNIIYAGSDGGGIYAIDGGTVKSYTEKNGLESGIILRMTVVGDGILISTGNAICYMDASGIRMIDKLAAYDDNVFDIKQIGDDIWLLHSKGIYICNIQSLFSDGELQIRQILKRDGLPAPVTANSWNALAGDGIMYVSTGKAVVSVNTRDEIKNEIVPFAAISEVFADGKQVDVNDALVISSDVQRVDIHIALLSYASKDGTISYMLEGFDSEPITFARSELTLISYTNLKGGKYTFRLYGTNAAGVRSEPVTLIINKKYALLEMPFIRMLLVFAGIGALVLCVRAFISHRTKAVTKQRQEYKEITGQIMSIAAAIADSKNEYTQGHSHRVAEYSRLVGKRLGMPENELEALYYAAILHDIGKTGVPDSILNKKGSLTDDEFDVVKAHVLIGAELLSEVEVIEGIALGAKYHHERVDGKGYAEGLSGEDIPQIAKIICVCNAFDSMLSDRPYKKAMTIDGVQSELIQNAGRQFDERVTAILISLIHEGSVPF